jgi:hypothetical protein
MKRERLGRPYEGTSVPDDGRRGPSAPGVTSRHVFKDRFSAQEIRDFRVGTTQKLLNPLILTSYPSDVVDQAWRVVNLTSAAPEKGGGVTSQFPAESTFEVLGSPPSSKALGTVRGFLARIVSVPSGDQRVRGKIAYISSVDMMGNFEKVEEFDPTKAFIERARKNKPVIAET